MGRATILGAGDGLAYIWGGSAPIAGFQAMSEIKTPLPQAKPSLEVTDSAAKRVKAIVAGEDRPGLRLRISVSGGGCSGFQYGFALDDKDEEGDVLVERDGAQVVVDGMSLMYLLGSRLDFVDDLTGSYFRMENPNASSACGCGTSFAV